MKNRKQRKPNLKPVGQRARLSEKEQEIINNLRADTSNNSVKILTRSIIATKWSLSAILLIRIIQVITKQMQMVWVESKNLI